MPATRTVRLAAALAALTLTTAACSSSTDNNVTANTTADVAADVTAAAEVTTPAPTTTMPAMEEPTATTAPTTNPTTTTTEAATDGDVEVNAGTPNDDTVSIDTEEETEEEVTQPNYENRHPDSVLPDSAYLDHDAIRALFPECPPAFGTVDDWEKQDWMVERENYWFAAFENWDTETITLSGERVHPSGGEKTIVSGWWTDEQINMYLPGGGLTEASVRDNALYEEVWDQVLLYGPEAPPDAAWSEQSSGPGDGLFMRLQTAGLEDSESVGDIWDLVGRDGIAGYNPTTDIHYLGTLIWEWMVYRIQDPPIDEEPTAWGIHTLFDTRSLTCVAEQMLNVCNGDREIDSPLLEPTHRIGHVLRSIVCEFKN